MNGRITVSTATSAALLVFAGSVFVQGIPPPGDMQQRLEQKMTQTRRATSESTTGAHQSFGEMKSEAEKKMEETGSQHKSQADGKMTEEIEKAKRKAEGPGR